MSRFGLAESVRIGLLSVATWLVVACSSPLTVATPTPAPVPAIVTPATPTPVPAPAATAVPLVAATTEAVAQPASETDTPAVELRAIIAKLDRSGTISVLNDGDELASCLNPELVCEDLYGLYIEPSREAYIYAFQQDAKGKISVLFPNAEYSQQGNPVPPGTTLWVPDDFEGWFYLDDQIGQETIFVAAGPKRIDSLERLVASVSGGDTGNTGANAQLATWLSGSRGPGGVTKRTVPLALPDGQPMDLETLVLNSAGEDEFVHQVKFQHVPPGVVQ